MSKSAKTILYLETRMTGHRPSYLRRIANIASDNGYRFLLAMPASCFEHVVVKQLITSNSSEHLIPIHCSPLDTSGKSSSFVRMLYDEYCCARFYKEALTSAKRNHTVDLVVAGMFDDTSIYSALFRFDFPGIPWLGIVMRQHFHFKTMGLIGPPESRVNTMKKHLFLYLLKSMKKEACLLTIDKTLKQYIDEHHKTLRNNISFLPDAVDDHGTITDPDMRRQLGIPNDSFVIICYGTLRENKGVRLLLETMRHLPDNIHVLLAGTQSETIRQCINDESNNRLIQSSRLHQIDRYIDVAEDPDFFNAADIVWIAYKDYYSMSAVLIQAAQYGKPVLATRTGLVGMLTKEYNTGEVVDTTDNSDVLLGINKLINNDENLTHRRYRDLATAHSLDAFERKLMKAIDAVIE